MPTSLRNVRTSSMISAVVLSRRMNSYSSPLQLSTTFTNACTLNA